MSQRNIYRAEPHNVSREIFLFPHLFPLFLVQRFLFMNHLQIHAISFLKWLLPGRVLFLVGSKSFASDIGYAFHLRIANAAEECQDPSRDLPRAMIMALMTCACLYVAMAWNKKKAQKGKGKRPKNHPVTSRVKVIVPPFWGGEMQKNQWNKFRRPFWRVYRGPPLWGRGRCQEIDDAFSLFDAFMSDVDNPAVPMALVFSKPGGWWTSYS